MIKYFWIVVLEGQEPQFFTDPDQAAGVIGHAAIEQFADVEDANILMLLEDLQEDCEQNPEKFGIDGVGYAYMQTMKF